MAEEEVRARAQMMLSSASHLCPVCMACADHLMRLRFATGVVGSCILRVCIRESSALGSCKEEHKEEEDGWADEWRGIFRECLRLAAGDVVSCILRVCLRETSALGHSEVLY